MTPKLAALVLCLLLLSVSAFSAAEGMPGLSHQEIAERALFELMVDGPFGDGNRIRTGEVLLSIPYQPGTHSWSDCCVPDSITQSVPPAEEFMTNG